MGGRQSRTTSVDVDVRSNRSPTTSRRRTTTANPNLHHRPLPEIPSSQPALTEFSALTVTSSVVQPHHEPEATGTEHVDVTSQPRIIGIEHHSYGHRRRRHHNGVSSGSSLESVLLIRGLTRLKCPLCSKELASTELEHHIVVCLARPRVLYNVDTLTFDAGECTICLDDMVVGDKIARLPCLCIYHIWCIQQWHKVNQTCPVHLESELAS